MAEISKTIACIEAWLKQPVLTPPPINNLYDALELLKEQKEREKNICKRICDFIRGGCSTDTDDDKDFVCYEIQKCFTEGR